MKRDKKVLSGKIYPSWMRDIQREKIEGILQRVDAKSRVLDIGSGPGFLGDTLRNIYQVDVDLQGLKQARGRRVLASGDCLPFKPDIFKTVFCMDSIHLLRDSKDISRVLDKGGDAVISLFCNEYNKKERMMQLKGIFKEWRIEKEFFVGDCKREMDAVIICKIKR